MDTWPRYGCVARDHGAGNGECILILDGWDWTHRACSVVMCIYANST